LKIQNTQDIKDLTASDVAVIMSAYNTSSTIMAAIDSVLAQTWTKFIFYIIDDASQDDTLAVIREAALADNRIKLIANEKNIGLAASLNQIISATSSKYIFRMDADDISYPERFITQLSFLQKNEGVDLLGTSADLIDHAGVKIGKIKMEEDSKKIYLKRYRKTVVIHPSVLIRRRFFEKYGYYDESLRRAQDMDLWLRALGKGAVICNLPASLMVYRKPKKPTSDSFIYGLRVKMRSVISNKDYIHTYTIVYDVISFVLARLRAFSSVK
jgi:glycosyltransferase involved in cell wall biosynthesis